MDDLTLKHKLGNAFVEGGACALRVIARGIEEGYDDPISKDAILDLIARVHFGILQGAKDMGYYDG